MIEYRFRHSRGYNFYTRSLHTTKAVTERIVVGILQATQDTRSWKLRVFRASFILEMIKAVSTEETTIFDNEWPVGNNIWIFARKEPRPVLWRCLNPKCNNYKWKSSPRHTMGCPKCRKDDIELVNKPIDRTVGCTISTTKVVENQGEADNSCQQRLF